ncbi:LysR family transcriptional regulator [Planctomicrobium sp. SH661]|uniref:LysR family transcriptional regulator n=1 Tax=Planctomicrobium sp. SH661 TaxID=3448124 RepID=UPI003F5B41C4
MKDGLRYKDLQLATLRSFCEVAVSGNFTEAGKQLHLSTSTVWQQVRALERKLKVRLVRKQGRTVVLTAEGKLLLELAQEHVTGLDSLVRLFETGAYDLPQHLIIASSPYFMSYHLPQPTCQFIAANQTIQVNFSILDTPAEILRSVARGEADLGLTVKDPEEQFAPTLEFEEVFSIPLVLMTSSKHPLVRKKTVKPEDLTNYPLIMTPPKGCDSRALQKILRRHSLADRIRPVMETKQMEIIARYVALDVGIAVCHISLDAKRLLPGIHLRELDPQLPKLSAVIVVRKGAHLPSSVEEFRTTLRKAWTAANGAQGTT